jgi:hypothetical protein
MHVSPLEHDAVSLNLKQGFADFNFFWGGCELEETSGSELRPTQEAETSRDEPC